MRRWSWAVVVGVVAGGSLAGVGAAADPPRITRAVQATSGDVDPGRTYSGPSMAIDPENPNVIVAATGELRTRRCFLVRSTDAGRTWVRLESNPSLPSYPFCFSANFSVAMAQLAFGRDHTLYLAMPGWDTQDRLGGLGNVSVLLARSTDLGDNWETTVVHDARGRQNEQVESNRPVTSLTVDTSGPADTVYVGWFRAYPNQTAPNQEPVHPMMAVSTDGGKTFGPPVDVAAGAFTDAQVRADSLRSSTTAAGATTTTAVAGSRAAQPDNVVNFGGRDPSIAIDRKGTIYVAWRYQTANHTPRPAPALFLSKSTDKGRTFTISRVTPFDYGVRGLPVLRWSPEGGSQGTLHLVYEGSRVPHVGGEADAMYVRSTDGGATWSPPKVLNDDDPSNYYGQYVPTLTVAPNGRLDAAWWDLRNDPGLNFANDVYHSYSTDNGLTWSPNQRISDQIVDRRIGVFGNNFDVTSPPGLASVNQYVAIGWDDTRNARPGELGAGVQDIFVANVQYSPLATGTSRAAKIVLAGAAGLVVVGLVLVLMAFAARRRAAGPPGPAERPARTAADVS